MWQFRPAGVCSPSPAWDTQQESDCEHPAGLAGERRVISTSGEQLCPLPSGSAGKTLKDPFRLSLQPSPKQNCVESMGTARAGLGMPYTEALPPEAALLKCH